MSARRDSVQKRRLAAVALCCLVVLLAGCSGFLTLGGDDTSNSKPTSEESADTRLANVSATHNESLRSAGNVTVTGTVEVSTGETRLNQTTQWHLDFESGRISKSRQPLRGTESEAFRTANKTVYKRFGSGANQFIPPEETDSLAFEEAVPLSIPIGSVADRYERRGTRTANGVNATVYVTDEFDAAPEGYRTDLSTAAVERYRSVVVVAPSGYVINETAAITISGEGQTRQLRQTVRFTDPGRTSVKKPGWLDEAKTRARRPGPGDVVTRNYPATGDGGLVELEASAEKQELDPPATIGPQISETPLYRNDLLNSVRVGSIARYYFLLDTVERVEIRSHYDQSQITPQNESKLRLAVRNDTSVWDLLNTSVDEQRNIVTATITDPESLEKYQGKTMIAMQFETFVKRLGKQSY